MYISPTLDEEINEVLSDFIALCHERNAMITFPATHLMRIAVGENAFEVSFVAEDLSLTLSTIRRATNFLR